MKQFPARLFPALLCAAAPLMLTGLTAFAQTNTVTATRWFPLCEVLQKWDAVPLESVEKAAESGEITALHYLGYCHSEGHRVATNATIGIRWYTRAGEKGYAPSFSNIGVLYQRGRAVPRDYTKMAEYFRKAVDQGYSSAMRYLGDCFRDGHGVPRNISEALGLYKRAAQAGDIQAFSALGRLYLYEQGVSRDLNEARRWFEKGVAQGDPLAEINLGLLLEEEGKPEAALKLFQKSAEQGRTDAMFKLYQAYRRGSGVAEDYDESKKWLRKAAEAGDSTAQCELGYLLEHASDEPVLDGGRPRFLYEAVKWYTRAAEKGHAVAQRHLAECYLHGKGVDQDEEKGLKWMRAAADSRDRIAILDLGELYARGVGEPRSADETPLRILQRVAAMPSDDGYFGARRASRVHLAIIHRYRHGLGTSRDLVEAGRWYCLGVLAGADKFTLTKPHPQNQVLYSQSSTPDQHVSLRSDPVEHFGSDFLEVRSLYLRAAEPGNTDACERIARMYALGDNVPQDPVRELAWLRLAVERGSASAKTRVPTLESSLNTDQINSAGRLQSELQGELDQIASRLGRESERSHE